MNDILALFVLALPTSIKIVYDLYAIKKDNKPIHHRSELHFTCVLGLFLAVLMALVHPMYNETVFLNELRNGAIEFGIFFLLFDPAMGIALHSNPWYVGTGPNAASWDKKVAAMGPYMISFLRVFVSFATSLLYFNYQPY